MHATGTTGNLMSLGAIDFGLVVDGSVVIVEGALAAMAAQRVAASEALSSEARIVGRPLAYAVVKRSPLTRSSASVTVPAVVPS